MFDPATRQFMEQQFADTPDEQVSRTKVVTSKRVASPGRRGLSTTKIGTHRQVITPERHTTRVDRLTVPGQNVRTTKTTSTVERHHHSPSATGATRINVADDFDDLDEAVVSRAFKNAPTDVNHNYQSEELTSSSQSGPLMGPPPTLQIDDQDISSDALFKQMHSPGGQSDASWASVPSAFNSPYPNGKIPIDIPVASPSLSDGSQDGSSTPLGATSGVWGVESMASPREIKIDNSPDKWPEKKASTPQKVREVHSELSPRGKHQREPGPQDTSDENKKFLKKVQRELDEQRTTWKGDIDQLTGGMVGLGVDGSPNGIAQGTSSFVDTTSGKPVFKAMVDLAGYNPRDITVTVDKLMNKIVVQAVQLDVTGHATRTFTQRVQMPRFADDQHLRSKLSKNGKLKLEVPLIYYFDNQKQSGRQAKSFVYQVNTGKGGGQRLEILVNTGSGYRAKDLKVQVHDDTKLVIIGEKPDSSGKVRRKLIKQYSLPQRAKLEEISSKLGKDGRLQVNVPLRRVEDK